MFKTHDPTDPRAPAHEHWSFAEVAAEIGCAEGDLRRRFEDHVNRAVEYVDPDTGIRGTRNIPVRALTGFRAIAVDDYARLVRERGLAGKVKPPAGFPDVVRYDEVEKESGLPGHKFADMLAEAKIRDDRPPERCLSADGRKWALDHLGALAVDAVPPEVTGAAVARYRDMVRGAIANAETEASAKGKPFTPKDRAAVVAKVKARAIEQATRKDAA